MTYTFTPTTYNIDIQQHQTGVIIDGETVCFMTDADAKKSHHRAVVAAMLMAIEELENDCHCNHKTVLLHDDGDCPRCEACNGKVYL